MLNKVEHTEREEPQGRMKIAVVNGNVVFGAPMNQSYFTRVNNICGTVTHCQIPSPKPTGYFGMSDAVTVWRGTVYHMLPNGVSFAIEEQRCQSLDQALEWTATKIMKVLQTGGKVCQQSS
jgi:hypothetical protein